MLQSERKAIKYLNEKKIFPITRTDKYLLYGVDAETGIWNVRYDILKDHWGCTCRNVRNTYCSHIKACILYNGETIC